MAPNDYLFSLIREFLSSLFHQGESAWLLCDSKNIPREILRDLAAEKNLVVDIETFDEKLEEHKGP